MKAKCPFCGGAGCDRCEGGYIEVALAPGKMFALMCTNVEECGFENGGRIGGVPKGTPGPCVMCDSPVHVVPYEEVDRSKEPAWFKNQTKFHIRHLERDVEALRKLVEELKAFARTILGERVLTVKEAGLLRVCRICKGDDTPPFVFDFGAEYAHEACLGKTI